MTMTMLASIHIRSASARIASNAHASIDPPSASTAAALLAVDPEKADEIVVVLLLPMVDAADPLLIVDVPVPLVKCPIKNIQY